MDRRDFMKISGIGLGALMLPIYGRSVAAEVLLSKMDAATKKKLADVALERREGRTARPTATCASGGT